MGKVAYGPCDESGQATVELAVVLPVALIVAVIVVNALSFFGVCALADRVGNQTACALGSSPQAGESPRAVAARIETAITEQVAFDNVSVSVGAQSEEAGRTRFRVRLEYEPTLFGLGLRREIFGVAMPPLVHETQFVVDVYRPGMLF